MRKGRNISNENLYNIFHFIDNFEPTNDIEKRDLEILKLAYIKDMSSGEIAKLGIFYGIGNRSVNGIPLSDVSISRIIKSYNLEYEKRIDYTKRNNYNRRKEIQKAKARGKYDGIKKQCVCGKRTELELHHKKPISEGGSDDISNMIWLCKDCHKKIHIRVINEKNIKNNN